MARESLESRVARLEEAMLGAKEDRIEARADRKDMISRLDALTQTIQSTGNTVANLALEKCGERLDRHDNKFFDCDERLRALEGRTQNLPKIETEVMFWRRVLGGGMHALWKIAALIIGSGTIGAFIMKTFFAP